MKTWSGRIFLLVVLAALGYGIVRFFFPDPVKVIRKQLTGLAQTVSFDANEGALAKLSNAQKVGSFFLSDVEVIVDIPNQGNRTFVGRDDLVQAAHVARRDLSGLQVEFPDIEVLVGRDGQSATANVTVRAQMAGARDDHVQELRFTLEKVEGDWLIGRIQTVKTLE